MRVSSPLQALTASLALALQFGKWPCIRHNLYMSQNSVKIMYFFINYADVFKIEKGRQIICQNNERIVICQQIVNGIS